MNAQARLLASHARCRRLLDLCRTGSVQGMGKLIYGTIDIDIEDRLLAHVQIVIVNKLRRGEPLLMSWLDSPAIGDGRSAVWLHPNVTLYFKFAGSRSPQIDREWLRVLSESAESSTGLVLRNADGALTHAAGKRAG